MEPPARVETFADAGWDEVLASPRPVLIGFWAEWCVPSRTLASDFEAVATHYGSSLRVGCVDVDANPQAVARHAVQGLPTVLLLKGGESALRRVGLLGRDPLLALLAPLL